MTVFNIFNVKLCLNSRLSCAKLNTAALYAWGKEAFKLTGVLPSYLSSKVHPRKGHEGPEGE
jgi:hypothetical protein